MIFGDWEEKSNGIRIREKLFWECNMEAFDWYESRAFVMQRIVERGRIKMLHKETVKRETFGLLRTLMKDTKLSDFVLVGGAALALFAIIPFDEKTLEKYLS